VKVKKISSKAFFFNHPHVSVGQGCPNCTVLQSLAPTCLVCSMPSETLICWFMCVKLGFELNFAGHWPSRSRIDTPP